MIALSDTGSSPTTDLQPGDIVINADHVGIVIEDPAAGLFLAHAVKVSRKGHGVITTRIPNEDWQVFRCRDSSLANLVANIAKQLAQRTTEGSIPFSLARCTTMLSTAMRRRAEYEDDAELVAACHASFFVTPKAIARSVKVAARFKAELPMVKPEKVAVADVNRKRFSLSGDAAKYGWTCIDFTVFCFHIAVLMDAIKLPERESFEWVSRKPGSGVLTVDEIIAASGVPISEILAKRLPEAFQLDSRSCSPEELLLALGFDDNFMRCADIEKVEAAASATSLQK